jgi:hypothetical protein
LASSQNRGCNNNAIVVMGHLPLTSLPFPAPPRPAQREAAQGMIEMIEESGYRAWQGREFCTQILLPLQLFDTSTELDWVFFISGFS